MPGFDLNTVTLSGNLTRDPELRSTGSGTPVASLRVAANNRRKVNDQWVDEPMYFDVTVWAGMGQWCGDNLHKGDKVVVGGRLMWREFTDKDNNKRQAVSITADSVVPVPRNANGSSTPSGAAPTGPSDPQNAPSDDDAPPFHNDGFPSYEIRRERLSRW